MNNAYSYVVFNLANKCNTVCRYCFQDSTPENEQFLPLETIKKCLDYCLPRADSKLFAQFTGGEIFLHPEIWEILDYAKSKGWALRLQTNGLTIGQMTPGQLSFLSREGKYPSMDTTKKHTIR
jgi:7,8-dihydro-6-hydroxymethylpterin dimethyltransferase